MIAVQVFGWCALAVGMVAVEILLGTKRPPHTDAAARSTDQLMVLSTGVALLGGLLGALVFPGLGIASWLAAPAGLLTGVAGLWLRAAAMRRLGRHYTLTPVVSEGHRLVTGGPYRFVRHPGYTGIVLQLLGLALLAGSLASVAFVLPVIALLPLRIRVEEHQLVEYFGVAYRDYQRRTPYRFVVGLI